MINMNEVLATEEIAPVNTNADGETEAKSKRVSKPKIPVITFENLTSCENTLTRASDMTLSEIKKIHDAVKSGEIKTIAKDCTLSRTQRVFTLSFADKPCTKPLESIDQDFNFKIVMPKLPKVSDYNRGAQYEGRISLFANMLRSVRDVHEIRELEIASQAKQFNKVELQTETQIVIDYKSSLEHIAYLVADLISPDSLTTYVVMSTLCEKFGGNMPTDIELEHDIKLGRVNALKASL